ncbi:unnamed protein product [Urochloa humidicola]
MRFAGMSTSQRPGQARRDAERRLQGAEKAKGEMEMATARGCGAESVEAKRSAGCCDIGAARSNRQGGGDDGSGARGNAQPRSGRRTSGGQ